MTAAEFDGYTSGKTLTYGVAGQPYGVEQYLPGRRVLWAFVGQECRSGHWYDSAGLICFIYDDAPADPQCWSFYVGSSGLRAHFSNDPAGSDLIEVQQSPGPMSCPGPDLGV